jgi:hypothetical protein
MNFRVFAALATLCVTSAFGATSGDLLRDLRTPSVGTPVIVNNVTLTVGHLKLTLASGSATKLTAAGEPVGFFFKGAGRLEYTAEATEMPVVTRNVKTDSHATLTGATVSEDITEAMVMLAGTDGPDLGSASGGAALADENDGIRSRFNGSPDQRIDLWIVPVKTRWNFAREDRTHAGTAQSFEPLRSPRRPVTHRRPRRAARSSKPVLVRGNALTHTGASGVDTYAVK